LGNLSRHLFRAFQGYARTQHKTADTLEILAMRLQRLQETLSRMEGRLVTDWTKVGAPAVEEAKVSTARSVRLDLQELDAEPPPPPPPGIGWVPYLTVSTSIGVAVCALGDALSRSTRGSSQLPFWAGLLIIVVPVAFRLYSAAASRRERLCLVLLFGLALYLVKVMQSPFGFTYPDELVHVHNANEIVSTGGLFNGNSLLPVTPKYPGLESVAAAISATTGLGTFGAGLIAIGAARLIIMLALFLLFERVSGSPRIAGVGAAIYAANANFVFFSAQFSYESMALPLLLLVLAALAERQASEGSFRRAWTVPILLVTCAIVVTHHLTSYALVAVLAGLTVAAAVRGGWTSARGLWPFALFALVASIAWLIVVASSTVGYLTPVFSRALTSTFHTISGEAGPRRLFSANSTGYVAPPLERLVGFASVVILAAGLPFGLWRIWQRYRANPFALVFAIAGSAFFGVILLRFAPAAWETANRASEFLFIGLAFVLALVSLDGLFGRRVAWLGTGVITACLTVAFCGGVIAGWQPLFRLAHPYEVKVGSRVLQSESRMLGSWTLGHLGPEQGFAATQSDARILLAYGRERAVTGGHPDVRDILNTPTLEAWQLPLLDEHHLRYVAVDLREKAATNIAGYYFGLRPGEGVPDVLLDPRIAAKFDKVRADRLYDSGTISVYDLKRVFDAPAQR
jgi:hypothetical protein